MTDFISGPVIFPGPIADALEKAKEKVKEWWDSGDDEESPSEGVSDAKPKLPETPQVFIDQYFLTENITDLSAKNRVFRPAGYENFTCLDELHNDIQSEIVAKPGLKTLLDLTPAQMAYLVPKIRIFKKYCGEDGRRSMVEFPFKANYDESSIQAILSNQGTAGSSVGIKDLKVDWRTGNKTEAGLGRQMGVQLSIYAQSAGDLFYSETIDGQLISISDFANRAGDREVRIVLGWADPKKYPPGLFSKSLIEGIRKSRIALDCHILNHTLNFERTGEVTLTVEMNGALEEIMGFDSAPVFSEPAVDVVRLEEQKKDITRGVAGLDVNSADFRLLIKLIEDSGGAAAAEKAEREIKIGIEEEKKEELKKAADLEEKIRRRKKEDKEARFKSIVEKLQNDGHMYYIDVPLESIKNLSTDVDYNVTGYDYDGPRLSHAGTIAIIKSIPGSVHAPPHEPESPDDWRINFFYFGSLLEVIYDLARDNEERGVTNREIRREFNKAREEQGEKSGISLAESKKCFRGASILDSLLPIVGTMVVRDQSNSDQQPYMINMADIPIAVKSYTEWFQKEVLATGTSNVSLNAFTLAAVNKLVIPSLRQTEQVKKLPGKYNAQINSVTSTAAANGEARLKKGGRLKLNDIKRNEFINPETAESLFRQRFIHQIISIPDPSGFEYSDILNIPEEEAAARGVYTMKLGRDRGLIKNISFNRAENSALADSRHTAPERENVLRLVPDVYDVTIDMYGNMNFLPGQHVIVDPMLPMMGTITNINSPARQIGLGGFYFVLNVQMIVSEAGFETILTCRQNFAPDTLSTGQKLSPKPIVRQLEQIPESRTIPSIANLSPAGVGAHLDAIGENLEPIEAGVQAENEMEFTEAEAEMLESVESEDEMIFFEDEVADINSN